MKQTIEVYPNDIWHSELHAKGIEHEHVTKTHSKSIVVTAEFDEIKVYGMLPFSINHEFDFYTQLNIPRRDENNNIVVDDGVRVNALGEVYKLDAPHIVTENYPKIAEIISKKARAECSVVVNIDPELDDLLLRLEDFKRAEPLLAAAETLNNAARLQYEAYLAKQKAVAEEKTRQIEAEREESKRKLAEAEAKVTAWIEEKGSMRLKLGRKEGHNCTKLLVMELVDEEFPGAILDYDRKVSTKDRSCPTLEALQKLPALRENPWVASADIVWLPYGLSEIEYPDPMDNYADEVARCEAIEIVLNISGNSYLAYMVVEC